jgi:hypothetical protein
MTHEPKPTSRLGLWLTVTMVFAMLMGPGPGLYLVNPDVNDPDAVYLIAGIPIVYAWGIFWFFVQVAIIVTAFRTVWREEEHDAFSNNGG